MTKIGRISQMASLIYKPSGEKMTSELAKTTLKVLTMPNQFQT